MKRRDFLAAGAALGMTPLMAMPDLTTNAGQGVQYYEWIRYHLPVGKLQRIVSNYYRSAAIPALNKAGINAVGVFNVKHGTNNPTLHVIIPHPSLESVVTLNDKLLEDTEFVEAGKSFLSAPTNEKAFVTMEKTILKAFALLPEIQIPTQKQTNSPRIFQVRTYESPSLTVAKNKIHMFNEGGEIEMFKRTGLKPVLFAETIAGNRMPSLMYMLAFDDFPAMQKAWDTFDKDPEWLKLVADPFYANNVSCINDWIWTPTAFSQI